MLTETAIFKGMLHNIYGKQILNMDIVSKCGLVGVKIIPGDLVPSIWEIISGSNSAETTNKRKTKNEGQMQAKLRRYLVSFEEVSEQGLCPAPVDKNTLTNLAPTQNKCWIVDIWKMWK